MDLEYGIYKVERKMKKVVKIQKLKIKIAI